MSESDPVSTFAWLLGFARGLMACGELEAAFLVTCSAARFLLLFYR
jgi:hypothetical protein